MAKRKKDSRDPERNPLELLHIGQLDSMFASILEEVAEAQEQLDALGEASWDSVGTILDALNELWSATDWPGSAVEITGRLRYAHEGMYYHDIYRTLTEGWPSKESENGVVFDVVGQTLICGYFGVEHIYSDGEDDNETDGVILSRPGRKLQLNLVHPLNYDEDQDEENENDFAIYPNDIAYISFCRPSVDAIGNELRYHFPQIWKKLAEYFPIPPSSNKQLTTVLKEFSVDIDPAAYHGYDLPNRLGEFMYKMIEFDDEYYEVVVHGPVKSVDSIGGPCTSRPTNQAIKYKGLVVGIRMEPDENTDAPQLRPTIYMSIPQPGFKENFFLLAVPAESLTRMRNLRTLHTGFGKKALYDFRSPVDVTRFFRSMYSEDNGIYTALDWGTLGTITESLPGTVGIPVGENQPTRIFIPRTSDIKKIVSDFYSKVAEREATEIDTVLDPHAYDEIRQQMNRDPNYAGFYIGDRILVMGPVPIIEETSEDDNGVALLCEDDQLMGTVVSTVIAPMPDMDFHVYGTDEVWLQTVGLGLILEGVSIRTKKGDTRFVPFESTRLVVPLLANSGVDYFRVEDTLDPAPRSDS